jgi:hypothetical protein
MYNFYIHKKNKQLCRIDQNDLTVNTFGVLADFIENDKIQRKFIRCDEINEKLELVTDITNNSQYYTEIIKFSIYDTGPNNGVIQGILNNDNSIK